MASLCLLVAALAAPSASVPRAPALRPPLLRLRGGEFTTSQLTNTVSDAKMVFVGPPEVTPSPSPILLGTCLGWCAYGLFTRDVLICLANQPALVLALWSVLKGELQPDVKHRLSGVLLLHVLGVMFCAFALPSRTAMATLYGIVCNVLSISYHAATLATVRDALVDRSSKGISRPAMLVNAASGVLWLTYARALGDAYLQVPYLLGLLLAAVQALICVALPGGAAAAAKPARSKPQPKSRGKKAAAKIDRVAVATAAVRQAAESVKSAAGRALEECEWPAEHVYVLGAGAVPA